MKISLTASVIDATSAEFKRRCGSTVATWRGGSVVLRHALKPFIANAVVATWLVRCYGHVAHGTSRLYHSVSVST